MYTLERKLLISKPLADVFSFFERPENLEKITPSHLGFKILTPTPIEMKAGAVIDYTIRVLGFRVRWTTLITEYNPPVMFADQQLKGPYHWWNHQHHFRAVGDKTEIVDHLTYALPFGWLGRLVHALYVRQQLNRIFDHRSRIISEIFS